MPKISLVGWIIIVTLVTGISNLLTGYAKNKVPEKIISNYSKICAKEFEGENVKKCEDDVRFYSADRINALRADFEALKIKAKKVDYEVLGLTVGHINQIDNLVRISSVKAIDTALLSDSISLDEFKKIESFVGVPIGIEGVIRKQFYGDDAGFNIIPEGDIKEPIESRKFFREGIRVTEAEFGTSDRQNLEFCSSDEILRIPFTARDHPCFGTFLINLTVDGSGDKIYLTRRLLAYQLKFQDLNAIEQKIVASEANNISALFRKHLSVKCWNTVEASDKLKVTERLSLREAKIFSHQCDKNLFLSKILLPQKFYKLTTDGKLQLDDAVKPEVVSQLAASAQNLAGCTNGVELIRSTYKKDIMMTYIGNSYDLNSEGGRTMKINILGRTVVLPINNRENIVLISLYSCNE